MGAPWPNSVISRCDGSQALVVNYVPSMSNSQLLFFHDFLLRRKIQWCRNPVYFPSASEALNVRGLQSEETGVLSMGEPHLPVLTLLKSSVPVCDWTNEKLPVCSFFRDITGELPGRFPDLLCFLFHTFCFLYIKNNKAKVTLGLINRNHVHMVVGGQHKREFGQLTSGRRMGYSFLTP